MKKSLRGSLGQKDQRSEICSQTYMYCKMQKQTCRQLHVFKLKMNLSHNLKNGDSVTSKGCFTKFLTSIPIKLLRRFPTVA